MASIPRFGQITVLSQNVRKTYMDKKQEAQETGRVPDQDYLREKGEPTAELDTVILWDRRLLVFSNTETPDLDRWKKWLEEHPANIGTFRKKLVPAEKGYPRGTGWWADQASAFLKSRTQANKTQPNASKINYVY